MKLDLTNSKKPNPVKQTVSTKKTPSKKKEPYTPKDILLTILSAALCAFTIYLFIVIEPPATTFYADIEIKDYGTITVFLDGEVAPVTVKNFVSLAKKGFYNGLTFHRIKDGFMMQGGDPNGDGSGGASKTIYGEFYNNGWRNPLSHTRGTISMARPDDYNGASSQFFIMQADHSDSLDGKYAAFGHVTSGMEIVDKICADAKPVNDNGFIPSSQQPVINSITIRDAE